MKQIVLALLTLAVSSVVAQQAPSPADAAMARMRDAMKKQNERIAQADAATATAQVAQIAAEAKVKELEAQIRTLSNNLKDETAKRKSDKETSDKVIRELEAKLAAKDKDFTEQRDMNLKWKSYSEEAAKVANAKEAERADAAAKLIVLQRQVEAHERKNREMYKLGVEILDRYKNFGLGTALLAKEPFTGSMRMKFQNYVQDYGDKLATQRIKPEASKNVGAPTPGKTGSAAKP